MRAALCWSDAKVQRIEKLIPDFVAGPLGTSHSTRADPGRKLIGALETGGEDREHWDFALH